MATIKIGNTTKRANSTSTTFSSSTELSCRLKESTSIHNPVFEVVGLTDGVLYNYASFNSYYYWVDDVIQVSNTVSEVYCHLDPLATYKSGINNTYAHVVYGDNDHKTPYKDDLRFGPDIKVDKASGVGVDSIDMGFTSNGDNWTVIMTAQNASSNFSYNSVCSYAMDFWTFQVILASYSGVVFSDIESWSGTDFIDILKNYGKRLLTGGQQALDNIISCVVVPIPLSYYKTIAWAELGEMALGPYKITLGNNKKVYYFDPTYVKTGNKVVSLARPTANTTYKWLNSPKYCSIKVTHPCGYTEINDESLLTNSSVYFWYSVGLGSGEYVIRVTSESSKDSDTIALISGSTGIDVFRLVPNTNVTMDSTLHTGVNQLLATATAGVVANNAGGMSPQRQSKDIHAGYAGIMNMTAGHTCFVDIEYYVPTIFSGGDATEYNSYCSRYGYPVDRYLKLGDLSGYCQCINASINGITAIEADKNIINSYLNNGIYLE